MLNDQNCRQGRFENEALIAYLRQDGYVHFYIKDHTNITTEVQSKLLEAYDELTSIPRGLIFETGEFVSISKDAHIEMPMSGLNKPLKAVAIIVKDLGQRILTDYFLRTRPLQLPYKVVTNVEEAVSWLNSLNNNTQGAVRGAGSDVRN